MAEIQTQDQKGFSGGIISAAEVARFEPNVFFASGRVIKNFDVLRDGGMSIRQGFAQNFSFSNLSGQIIKSVYFNGTYFFLSSTGAVYFSNGQSINPLSFNANKLNAFNPQGSLVISADLSTAFLNYPTNIRVTNIQRIGDQLAVFSDSSIPFKMFFSGNLLIVVPFFAKNSVSTQVENIWDKFPFYKTNEELEVGDFFFQKVESSFLPVSPALKPKITIVGEDLEAGECYAFLDPGYEAGTATLGSTYYVDRDIASLRFALRQPILFFVGRNSIVQKRVVDEASKVFTGFTDEIKTKVRNLGSNLSPNLRRVASVVYGNTDYFSWNLEAGITEAPLFLSSQVINPLFFALGFRFYCIIPYEHIPSTGTAEQSKYVKVADFYTEALKKKHGGSGGSGVVKCKIYELGWKTKNTYSGKRIIGGRDFVFPASDISDAPVNYTDNWISNDWIDGNPVDGGFLRDKSFYFTSSGKLSTSKLGRHTSFSDAIKVLLNTGDFNFVYNNVPYSTKAVAPEDYINPSEGAFLTFLNNVKSADDTLVFNLLDAFTYRLRDENGDSPEIRSFKLMNIGSLNPSGVQVITSTDKGIYFWGFDYGGTDPSTFLNLVKVSSFVVQDGVDIIEAYNKLYLRGEARDGVFFVSYSNDFRAFNTEIANKNSFSRFKNIIKTIKFGEFRIGFISIDDEGFGRFYVGNIFSNGEIRGICEYEVKNQEFVDVFKRDDFYCFVTKGTTEGTQDTYNVLQYGRNEEGEFIDDFNGKFYADFEDAGFTFYRRLFPAHGDFLKSSPYALTIRGEGLDDLQFAFGCGDFESVSKYITDGAIDKIPNRITVNSSGSFDDKCPGVRLRQQSGNRGVIGGYTVRATVGEVI